MNHQNAEQEKQQALLLLHNTLANDSFSNITNEVSRNGEPLILADSATMKILVGVKTRLFSNESYVISDEEKLSILAEAFRLNRVAYAAVVVWHAHDEQPNEIEWYKLN